VSDKTIQVGSQVTMHFTLKLTDNSVAETTKDREPAVFTVTQESLKDPVESKLIGLKAGEKMRVELSPDKAYGFPNPENYHVIPLTQFPAEATLQIGEVFQFDRPNGEAVPGIISKIEGDQITIDFNHPLSGQTLLFLAEVLSVE